MRKLNNYSTILFGAGLITYEIISIVNGETFGVAASGYSKLITVDSNPVYFWFSVSLGVVFGALLIWGGVERIQSQVTESDDN